MRRTNKHECRFAVQTCHQDNIFLLVSDEAHYHLSDFVNKHSFQHPSKGNSYETISVPSFSEVYTRLDAPVQLQTIGLDILTDWHARNLSARAAR